VGNLAKTWLRNWEIVLGEKQMEILELIRANLDIGE
jgi:hypothetical protein